MTCPPNLVRICLPLALVAGQPLAAKDPPPCVAIRASAAAGLNPDPAGAPLSVQVHVYQLKDPGEFARLGFEAAAGGRPGSELLGADYLARRELTLDPGAVLDAIEPLLAETRWIGVVALFRQPDPHHWRGLVRLAPPAPAPEPLRRGWLKRKLTRKPPPPPPPPTPELAFTVQDCWLRVLRPAPEPIPGQPEPFRPQCGGDAP